MVGSRMQREIYDLLKYHGQKFMTADEKADRERRMDAIGVTLNNKKIKEKHTRNLNRAAADQDEGEEDDDDEEEEDDDEEEDDEKVPESDEHLTGVENFSGDENVGSDKGQEDDELFSDQEGIIPPRRSPLLIPSSQDSVEDADDNTDQDDAAILGHNFLNIASQAEGIDIHHPESDDEEEADYDSDSSSPDPEIEDESSEAESSDEDSDVDADDAGLVASDRGGVAAMRSMYMDLYQEEGIDSLSTKAMNTYAEDGKTLDSKSILTRTASFKILLSTHPKILDSVLKGTILADARKDQELRDVLRKLKVHASDKSFSKPAIYLNIVADHGRKSPTPNELFQAADAMAAYCNGSGSERAAKKIDSFKKPIPTQASGPYSDRKYIASKSGRLSKQKVKNVEEFLLGLRKRLEDIDSSLYDQPLECPLVEIGYTHQSRKRLDDHRNHRGSNYIMNLFDATCNALWPARFKVHQFVIFVCTEDTHAVVAEILFTRICQCYVKNGGGFSHYPPGRSNKSAYGYTSVDWERFFHFNEGITDIAENLKADEMKWEAYLEKKRQEKKENENVVQKMLAKTDSIKQGLVGLYETEAEMNVHLETIQLMASNDESTV